MLKYQLLKRYIRQDAATLNPGEAFPSMRKYMQKHQVSLVTVNRALSELEKEGILVRKRGSGIFLAEKGKASRSNIMGIIMPYITPLFNAQLIRGIHEVLVKHNKVAMLGLSQEPPNQNFHSLDFLRQYELSGVIINPSSQDIVQSSYVEKIRALKDRGSNIVVVDIPLPGVVADFVGLDNRQAFFGATQFLLKKGGKKIGFIGPSSSPINFERLRGTQDALKNTELEPLLIDVSFNSDFKKILQVVINNQLDGIIIAHAGISVNLGYSLEMLKTSQKIHFEIAGVVEEGQRLPGKNSLTLEKVNIEMGREAAKMILKRLNNPALPTFFKRLPIKIHYYEKIFKV